MNIFHCVLKCEQNERNQISIAVIFKTLRNVGLYKECRSPGWEVSGWNLVRDEILPQSSYSSTLCKYSGKEPRKQSSSIVNVCFKNLYHIQWKINESETRWCKMPCLRVDLLDISLENKNINGYKKKGKRLSHGLASVTSLSMIPSVWYLFQRSRYIILSAWWL